MLRYWKWRRALHTEVMLLGDARVRITRKGRQVIGVEVWYKKPGQDFYTYVVMEGS